MNKFLKHVVTILILCIIGGSCWSQILPDDVCIIKNNRLIFKINTDWDTVQFEELSIAYNLDSNWFAGFNQRTGSFTIDGVHWKIKQISKSHFEVSKELKATSNAGSFLSDLFHLADQFFNDQTPEKPPIINYGINRLKNSSLLQQNHELVTIRLKGFPEAKSVYISGDFNNWAISESPLRPIKDVGWEIQIKLEPGKYLYKFIIDGQWTTDPNNELKELESSSNAKSVFYVYNYRFSLKSFENAKNIILAGSFNNFNEDELQMVKDQGSSSWILDLYLPDGMHYYKFIVDDMWITDPDNSKQSPDGRGNINSVLSLGKPYVFFLKGFEQATNVELAGNFNNWNTGEIFLEKVPGGWTSEYILGSGTYTYKFIVDGRWMTDPDNSNMIGSGDYINSVIVINPNYEFTLKGNSDASVVLVSGTFNDWSEDGYRMTQIDGEWVFPIHLSTGKYSYKFIVDKRWILDPDNELWEENEYGTDNSVIWIN